MNPYIGHEKQLYGVTELRLCGGKAEGMRLLHVQNGKGLDFFISVDRCADIAKLAFKGDNFSYFAPCGYVAPSYYQEPGNGFLKSFTAGFFTTCGLTAVGTPCTDDGEELPLHGTVSNIPAERVSYYTEGDSIHIYADIRDAALFSRQLMLKRHYAVSLTKNEIVLTDTIQNIGTKESPLEVLYHCNMGYPLLSENAVLSIPTEGVTARNDHAQTGIDSWAEVEKPQKGYEEMCFYHKMSGEAKVSLFNPDIKKGLVMTYDTENLPYFTQWKMMGEVEYVLGLEPGNCLPDGRAVMREQGKLEFLAPGAEKVHTITFTFTEES